MPAVLVVQDVEGAGFVHVRLRLDEPPEPLLCTCRSRSEMMATIQKKYRSSLFAMNGNTIKYMSSIPPPSLNPVVIEPVSPQPNTEVEIKLERNSSKRSLAHGQEYEVAVPYEFTFTRRITRPEYRTSMTKHTCDTGLANTKMRVTTRKYATSGNVAPTCVSEMELLGRRRTGTRRGSCPGEPTMPLSTYKPYLYEAKSILKAHGVKVYVFCYTFGHQHPLRKMLSDPAILIAEMVIDGSLVYIDTLYLNGDAVQESRGYLSGPP
ncbi:hypothetical protein DL767_011446 [Monosporascus sp. MG133]|nr:hypothetical protein DL767_011446 [Monosporascus sp. MG133]